jgi:hypothetical protein
MSVNYIWYTSILRHWPLRSKDSFACILSQYFVVDTEEPKTGLCFLEQVRQNKYVYPLPHLSAQLSDWI